MTQTVSGVRQGWGWRRVARWVVLGVVALVVGSGLCAWWLDYAHPVGPGKEILMIEHGGRPAIGIKDEETHGPTVSDFGVVAVVHSNVEIKSSARILDEGTVVPYDLRWPWRWRFVLANGEWTLMHVKPTSAPIAP